MGSLFGDKHECRLSDMKDFCIEFGHLCMFGYGQQGLHHKGTTKQVQG